MSDIPQNFGQYEIVEVIGTGGMAKVYRARQLNIERHVAIKIMSSALSDQAEFQDRFKLEADVFAKLEHPHILPIYDYGEHDNFVYLVLRLMEGGTLEKMIRGKQLALPDLSRLISQIAQGLEYAHENDIVHRDLKPNNILLDKFGNAYLMDFGIAKIISDAQASGMSTMLGTPAYMSPEQWRLEDIDHRIDIYSLGVMTYEMLTGRMPFNGQTPYHLMYAHLHEEPMLPSHIFEGLTADIDAVVLRALAKDPNARYQTASELAADLDEAVRAQAEDTRSNLASLTDEPQSGQADKDTKPDILGSILLALDRPSGRMYAVPKVEDFVDVISHKKAPTASRRIETWNIDDILQELETPAKTTINTVRLKSMMKAGELKQSYLGVQCHPVRLPEALAQQSGQKRALLVAEVEPDSLADKAGLMLGDTLVTLDNEALRNQDDLITLLSGDRVGKSVIIHFIRAGVFQETQVTLESYNQ